MKSLANILALAAILLMPISCSNGLEVPGDRIPEGSGIVRAEFPDYADGNSPLQSDEALEELTAFHFIDGSLSGVYSLLQGVAVRGQSFELPLEKFSGTIYMVARTGTAPGYQMPEEGCSESDWLGTVLTSDDGSSGVFFTGKADVNGTLPHAAVPLSLERGVARFDLRIDVAGSAQVKSIVFTDVMTVTPLFSQAEAGTGQEGKDLHVDFPQPLSASKEGVAYVFGQTNPDLKVSVCAEVNGKEYMMESPLPTEIRRNTVYAVVLRADSISGDLGIDIVEWGQGGVSDAFPDSDRLLYVDGSATELPEGAALSQDGRTMTLPYNAVDFTLEINSDDELEVLQPDDCPFEIAPGNGINRFRIRKRLYAPGVPSETAEIRFHRKGLANSYDEDAIVFILNENPTSLSGRMSFDNAGYEHDFGTYTDNEFGIFTVPQGKEISVEFPDGEDAWIFLDRNVADDGPAGGDGNAVRVIGGWRPNDRTADGRRQEAVLVIQNTDGTGREEYTVARRNYGLPVTWFHGVWWCKYNSMGNSRSFEDQVLTSSDPAVKAGQTLFEYLESCSAEQYRTLWGWEYIGDSGQGMQVIEENGIAVLEGYQGGQTVHINKLPADALSPPGYELPSMEEFNRVFDATSTIWMMWNGTHQLREPWEGHSAVKRVQKRKNGIQVGSLELSDLIYIAMSSPDFPEHEPLVWYGPGAQWNTSGIMHNSHYNNMLFGVYSPQGQGWFISGGMANLYMTKNGAGNNDTRILRFKKSDVEYIY